MDNLLKNGTLKEAKQATDKPINGKVVSVFSQIFKAIFFVALVLCLMIFGLMGGFKSKLFIISIILIFIYGVYIVIFKKK